MLSGAPHSASTLSVLSPSVTSRVPQRNESAPAPPAQSRAAASVSVAAMFPCMAPTCLAAGERRLKAASAQSTPARGPDQAGRTGFCDRLDLSLPAAAEWHD